MNHLFSYPGQVYEYDENGEFDMGHRSHMKSNPSPPKDFSVTAYERKEQLDPVPYRQMELTVEEPEATKRYIPGDSAKRKAVPMASGLLDYFPDALAAVAEVSHMGNEKHNPGQPLHWSRGKSNDHADCIVRHLLERGDKDPAGVRHSAQMAWRALALLQEELEAEQGLGLPRGATKPGVEL